MRLKAAMLTVLAGSLFAVAQQANSGQPVQANLSAANDQNLPDAPVGAPVPSPSSQTASLSPAPGAKVTLSIKDAEAMALKNNPAISEARLQALASAQIVREVRSNLWPTAYATLTGVDAHENSRITAGGLNNPIIYERAAAGATVSQLITDFGHTTNLIASSRLQAQAEDQNARATKEDILLAVDQAFYRVLQANAILKVAQQTVDSRQLTADQVSALTKSQLKSTLDLSFARVNLAQASLLLLDAQNNYEAALASFSAILGYSGLQNFNLVEDTSALTPPDSNPDQLIAQAFSQRPEILALELETQSAEKYHNAERDLLFPTISALGAVGEAPIRNDHLSSWYGAAGVNVQIPIFNGFLYPAKAREADLRAQAARQRLLSLRNSISRDVRTSWLNANTAYQRVAVSQQLLDQSNQALGLAETRYRLGLGSIVEFSQAQLQQTQAEIGRATAAYDYRVALSVLRFQTTGI